MAYTDETEERVAQLEKFAGTSDGAMRRQDMVEVKAGELLQSMDRVYGSQQIARPRDEELLRQRLIKAADMAGEDWYYSWEVKTKDKSGKEVTETIEGPSRKLTDALVQMFGNCDLDTRSMDMGDHWLFLSRFIDLETGYSQTRPYQQRKSQKVSGKMDRERQLDIAYQIGCSKSARNVVVHSLGIWVDVCFEMAKDSLANKVGKDLPKWKERVVARLAANNIELARVEQRIGKTQDKWNSRDVANILATGKSIERGEITWDEAYPALVTITQDGTVIDKETGEIKQDGKPNGQSALDQLAGQSSGPTPEKAAESPGQPRSADQTGSAATEKKPPAGSIKTGAGDSGEAQADPDPTNEKEYVAHFEKWFTNEADPQKALARWNREKDLRNRCNVNPDKRDEMKDLVAKKVGG